MSATEKPFSFPSAAPMNRVTCDKHIPSASFLRRPIIAWSLGAMLFAAGCSNQTQPNPKPTLPAAGPRTFSSFDPPTSGGKLIEARTIKFEDADLTQV